MKSINIIQNDELDLIYSVVKSVVKLDIKKKTKRRPWVHGRWIFYKIAWDSDHTLTPIGSYTKRDHATVLHGLRKLDEVILTNDRIKKLYLECLEVLHEILEANGEKVIEQIQRASESYTNIQLAREISKLKKKAVENQKKLQTYINTDCPVEKEIAKVLREMDIETKTDLLFKAKTILKVKLALG